MSWHCQRCKTGVQTYRKMCKSPELCWKIKKCNSSFICQHAWLDKTIKYNSEWVLWPRFAVCECCQLGPGAALKQGGLFGRIFAVTEAEANALFRSVCTAGLQQWKVEVSAFFFGYMKALQRFQTRQLNEDRNMETCAICPLKWKEDWKKI